MSYEPNSKNLSNGEAKSLASGGLWIVSNWEQHEGDIPRHCDPVAIAQQALNLHKKYGGPTPRPIYFSIDYDIQSGDFNAAEDWIRKADGALGGGLAGYYGSYYLIKAMFDRGAMRWGWQCYAWSNGNWDSRAQIRQVKNNIAMCGGTIDNDTATVADFGQWQPGKLPSGATGGGDWFDMASQTDLENAVRKVLNEGTAQGSTSWAKTNQGIMSTVQQNFNKLNAIIDATDQASLQDAVRAELYKGTAYGTTSWGQTNQGMYGRTGDIINRLNAIQADINTLLEDAGSMAAHSVAADVPEPPADFIPPTAPVNAVPTAVNEPLPAAE